MSGAAGSPSVYAPFASRPTRAPRYVTTGTAVAGTAVTVGSAEVGAATVGAVVDVGDADGVVVRTTAVDDGMSATGAEAVHATSIITTTKISG